MSDVTELVFGLILWLTSCSFIFNLYNNKANITEDSDINISMGKLDQNNVLEDSQSFNISTTNSPKYSDINNKINQQETNNINQELESKIEELTLANEKINALQEELEFTSNQLESVQDESAKLEKQWRQKNQQLNQKILDLEKQCQQLKNNLEKQSSQLNDDFQDTTFEQINSLLTNYPTAKVMIKVKPDLPAKNLVALFKPLDNLLSYWGFQTIGKPWEQIPYNPQLHQPDSQDILVGELVYVRFIGYRKGDRIIYPAKVSRTLPGKKYQ